MLRNIFGCQTRHEYFHDRLPKPSEVANKGSESNTVISFSFDYDRDYYFEA